MMISIRRCRTDVIRIMVEIYRKPERGNIKEMAEACFAHTGVKSGVY